MEYKIFVFQCLYILSSVVRNSYNLTTGHIVVFDRYPGEAEKQL